MTSISQANSPIDAKEMEARYRRAEYLEQGIWTKEIAFNTTLFPIWIDGSDSFWYERETKEGKQYRLVDAAAASNDAAFDHALLATTLAEAAGQKVNVADLPIDRVRLTLSPLQVRFTAFDKWWLFDDSTRTCQEIQHYSEDFLLSPDGTKAAFVRDYNLWLLDVATGKEQQLTHDGENTYAYADAPAAYGAKITIEGLEALWSPDSKRLFTLQLDTRQVKTFPIIEHVPADGSLRPVVTGADRRVALAEDEHMETYRFLAIDVGSGRQQDAHYRRCEIFYNAIGFLTSGHGWWGKDSRFAYFVDLERGNQIARLVEFDTHSGACRVVIEETSDICFRLSLNLEDYPVLTPLIDSDEVIWYSERSGWAHLYLYDLKTGALKRTITEGEWLVRDILHYDAVRRELWIQTADRVTDRNPYYRDICRVDIDSGEVITVVSTDHEYVVINQKNVLHFCQKAMGRDIRESAGVSPSGRYAVTTRSRVDDIPVSLLLDQEGNEVLTLEEADMSGLPDNWQWPEPVLLKAADGETPVYGIIYRPSDFSENKSYPVLDYSYAAPEAEFMPVGSFTNSQHLGLTYLSPLAYAELGFVVVLIVGRGTSNRHKAFLDDPGAYLPDSHNQADRISGIKQIAKQYPYIDLNRVGIGEGQTIGTPVAGMLGHPEFYKVGVSNNAYIDMRLVGSFYADEVMLGRFQPKTSSRPTVHDYAGNLEGKLLLMHGMLDPMTPLASTLRLVEALQKANKSFDMLLLPNDGHFMCSYATRRAWDYFVEHLLGEKPPKDFQLMRSVDIFTKNIYAKGMIDESAELSDSD